MATCPPCTFLLILSSPHSAAHSAPHSAPVCLLTVSHQLHPAQRAARQHALLALSFLSYPLPTLLLTLLLTPPLCASSPCLISSIQCNGLHGSMPSLHFPSYPILSPLCCSLCSSLRPCVPPHRVSSAPSSATGCTAACPPCTFLLILSSPHSAAHSAPHSAPVCLLTVSHQLHPAQRAARQHALLALSFLSYPLPTLLLTLLLTPPLCASSPCLISSIQRNGLHGSMPSLHFPSYPILSPLCCSLCSSLRPCVPPHRVSSAPSSATGCTAACPPCTFLLILSSPHSAAHSAPHSAPVCLLTVSHQLHPAQRAARQHALLALSFLSYPLPTLLLTLLLTPPLCASSPCLISSIQRNGLHGSMPSLHFPSYPILSPLCCSLCSSLRPCVPPRRVSSAPSSATGCTAACPPCTFLLILSSPHSAAHSAPHSAPVCLLTVSHQLHPAQRAARQHALLALSFLSYPLPTLLLTLLLTPPLCASSPCLISSIQRNGLHGSMPSLHFPSYPILSPLCCSLCSSLRPCVPPHRVSSAPSSATGCTAACPPCTFLLILSSPHSAAHSAPHSAPVCLLAVSHQLHPAQRAARQHALLALSFLSYPLPTLLLTLLLTPPLCASSPCLISSIQRNGLHGSMPSLHFPSYPILSPLCCSLCSSLRPCVPPHRVSSAPSSATGCTAACPPCTFLLILSSPHSAAHSAPHSAPVCLLTVSHQLHPAQRAARQHALLALSFLSYPLPTLLLTLLLTPPLCASSPCRISSIQRNGLHGSMPSLHFPSYPILSPLCCSLCSSLRPCVPPHRVSSAPSSATGCTAACPPCTFLLILSSPHSAAHSAPHSAPVCLLTVSHQLHPAQRAARQHALLALSFLSYPLPTLLLTLLLTPPLSIQRNGLHGSMPSLHFPSYPILSPLCCSLCSSLRPCVPPHRVSSAPSSATGCTAACPPCTFLLILSSPHSAAHSAPHSAPVCLLTVSHQLHPAQRAARQHALLALSFLSYPLPTLLLTLLLTPPLCASSPCLISSIQRNGLHGSMPSLHFPSYRILSPLCCSLCSSLRPCVPPHRVSSAPSSATGCTAACPPCTFLLILSSPHSAAHSAPHSAPVCLLTVSHQLHPAQRAARQHALLALSFLSYPLPTLLLTLLLTPPLCASSPCLISSIQRNGLHGSMPSLHFPSYPILSPLCCSLCSSLRPCVPPHRVSSAPSSATGCTAACPPCTFLLILSSPHSAAHSAPHSAPVCLLTVSHQLHPAQRAARQHALLALSFLSYPLPTLLLTLLLTPPLCASSPCLISSIQRNGLHGSMPSLHFPSYPILSPLCCSLCSSLRPCVPPHRVSSAPSSATGCTAACPPCTFLLILSSPHSAAHSAPHSAPVCLLTVSHQLHPAQRAARQHALLALSFLSYPLPTLLLTLLLTPPLCASSPCLISSIQRNGLHGSMPSLHFPSYPILSPLCCSLCSSLRPCVPPHRVSSAPSSATGCTAACPPCTFLLILSSPHSAAHSAPHSAPVCLLTVSHQLHPAQRAARQHALLALSFLSYPLPTLLLTLLLTPPLCASSPCLISSIQRNGLHGSMPSLHFPSYPILSPLCCSLCSSLRPCVPPHRVSSAPSSATGCTAACPPCTFLLILSSPHSAAHSAPHSAPVCLLTVSHQLHPAQRAARQHALLALSFLYYPLPTLLLTLLLTPPLCASSPCLISSIQRNGLHGSMPSLHFPSYPILSPLCCSLCSSLRPCVPPHRVSSAPSSATGCTAACPPCTFLLILSSPHSAAHSAPHSAPVCLLAVSHQLHPAQRAARQHALLALSFLSYPLPTLLLTLLLTPPLCASSPCLISSIQRNGLHGSMPSLHFPSYPILSPLCCSLCSSLRPCVPPHRVSSAPSSATGCTAACPPCTFLLILSSPHSAAHSAPHSAPVCLLTVSHQLHPAQRAARQHALLALSFLSYPLPTLLLTLLLTPPLCASSPCLISSIQRNGLHGSMPSLHFPSYPILSPLCCSLCSSLRPCVPPHRVSSAPSSATGCTAACPPCTFLLILSSPHSAAHSAPHSAPVCLLTVSHQLHPAQRAARQHALLALSFLSYPLPTLLLTLLLTPPLCASSPCLISSIQRNGLHGSMPSLHFPSYPILSPLCCSLCSSLRPCVPPHRVSSAPSSATGCTAACPPCTFLLILSSPHSAAHSAPHSAPVCLLTVSHQLHPAQRAARQHALLALSFLSYPLPTLLLTLLLTPPLCASSPCRISSIQRNGLHGSMPSLHFPSYPILSPLCCSLCSSLRPCVPPHRVSSAPSSATGCTAACPPCTFLLILSSPHSAAHSAPHSAPVCLLTVSHQLHPAQRAARQHALLALSFLSYPLPTLLLTLLLTPPLCASSPCLISSIQRNGLHGSMPSLHFPSYPILSPLCCSLCSSLRPCVPPHRVSSAPSSATGCTAACPPCTFLLILSSPHSAAHSAPHSAPVCLLTVSHQLHPAQRAARQHALLALSFLSYPLPTLLLTLLLTPPLCASSPCLISSIQRNGLHGSMPSLHFPSYPILSPLCCSLCSSLRPCVPPHRVSSAPSSATGCTAACPPCTFLLILSSPHSAAHSAPHSAPVCLLTVSHQLHPAQRAARQHALLALSFLSYPLPTLLLTLLLTPPLCASSPCRISSIQRNGLHGSMPSLHFPSYPILSPLCCSLCSSLRPCVPPHRVASAPSSATGCTAACPPCTFLLILSSPHSAAHSAPHSAPVCLLTVSHQLHPAQRAARQHALLALSFLSYPLPTLLLTLLLTPPLCASSPCLISSIQRNGLHGSMPSLHFPSYPILSPLCCSLCSSLRPCVPPRRVSSAPSSATGCTAACPPCTFLLILSSPHSAAHSAPHSAPVCLLTVSHQLHPAQRAARQHALLALSFLSYPLPTLLLTLLLTPPLCASSPCLISSIQRNGLHGSMPSLHFPSYPILSPLCCSLCSSLRPCVPPRRVSSAPSSATGCTAACPPCTFLLILSSPHSAAHSAPHSAPVCLLTVSHQLHPAQRAARQHALLALSFLSYPLPTLLLTLLLTPPLCASSPCLISSIQRNGLHGSMPSLHFPSYPILSPLCCSLCSSLRPCVPPHRVSSAPSSATGCTAACPPCTFLLILSSPHSAAHSAPHSAPVCLLTVSHQLHPAQRAARQHALLALSFLSYPLPTLLLTLLLTPPLCASSPCRISSIQRNGLHGSMPSLHFPSYPILSPLCCSLCSSLRPCVPPHRVSSAPSSATGCTAACPPCTFLLILSSPHSAAHSAPHSAPVCLLTVSHQLHPAQRAARQHALLALSFLSYPLPTLLLTLLLTPPLCASSPCRISSIQRNGLHGSMPSLHFPSYPILSPLCCSLCSSLRPCVPPHRVASAPSSATGCTAACPPCTFLLILSSPHSAAHSAPHSAPVCLLTVSHQLHPAQRAARQHALLALSFLSYPLPTLLLTLLLTPPLCASSPCLISSIQRNGLHGSMPSLHFPSYPILSPLCCSLCSSLRPCVPPHRVSSAPSSATGCTAACPPCTFLLILSSPHSAAHSAPHSAPVCLLTVSHQLHPAQRAARQHALLALSFLSYPLPTLLLTLLLTPPLCASSPCLISSIQRNGLHGSMPSLHFPSYPILSPLCCSLCSSLRPCVPPHRVSSAPSSATGCTAACPPCTFLLILSSPHSAAHSAPHSAPVCLLTVSHQLHPAQRAARQHALLALSFLSYPLPTLLLTLLLTPPLCASSPCRISSIQRNGLHGSMPSLHFPSYPILSPLCCSLCSSLRPCVPPHRVSSAPSSATGCTAACPPCTFLLILSSPHSAAHSAPHSAPVCLLTVSHQLHPAQRAARQHALLALSFLSYPLPTLLLTLLLTPPLCASSPCLISSIQRNGLHGSMPSLHFPSYPILSPLCCSLCSSLRPCVPPHRVASAPSSATGCTAACPPCTFLLILSSPHSAAHSAPHSAPVCLLTVSHQLHPAQRAARQHALLALSFLSYPLPTLLLTLLLTPPLCASSPCLISSIQRNGLHGSMPSLHFPSYPILSPLCCSLCSSLRPCVPPHRVSSAPSSATGCTAACPPCTFLLILSSPHSAAHSAPHSAPVCLLTVSHQLHPAQRAARQHALLALSFLSYPLPTLLLTLLLTPPLCASSPCLISSIQRNGLHGSMPSLHFPSYPILSPLCCSLCSSLRPCVPPHRVSSAPSSATGCTAACPPCTFLLILSSPHSAAHSAPHSAPVCLLTVSHQLHPAQRAARQHALLALSFLSYPLPTLLLTLLLTPPLCASSPCLISSIQRNGLHGSMPSLHFPSYPILSPLCCSLCSSLRPCVPPHRVASAPSSATGCTAACPPCTFLLILSSPHSAAHSAPHSAPVCLLAVSHQLHPAQRAARQHALLALSFLSYPLPTLLLTLLLTPPLCASSPCLISSIQRNGLHGSMPSLHFPSYPILSPLCCSLCSSLRPCVPPRRVSSAPSSATGCTAACPPCTFLLILSSPHSAAHSAPHSAPVCLLAVSHQLHPAQRAARQHALLALSFLSYPLPTLLLTLLLTPPLCASSPCLISSIQRNGLHGSMPSLHFPSYPILSPLCCSLCSSLRPCVPPHRVSSAPSSATGCTAACPPCTFLLILSSPHSAAHSAPHSAPVCLLTVSHQLHPAQRAARQHALLALSFSSYPLPTLLLTLLLTPPLCASSPCLISSIQRNGLHGSMPSLHFPSYPILSPLCCSLCSSLRPCVPPRRVSSAPSSATGCTAACPPCTFLLILSSPHSAAHSAPHSAPVCLLAVSHQLHPAQRAARQHALLALSFLSYPLPTLLLTLLLTPPLCASSPCLISSIQRNGLHGSMPSLHFPSYPILSPLCCSLCSSLRPCVPPHRVSSAPSSATGCTAACPPCTFLLILSSPHSAAHSAPHSAPVCLLTVSHQLHPAQRAARQHALLALSFLSYPLPTLLLTLLLTPPLCASSPCLISSIQRNGLHGSMPSLHFPSYPILSPLCCSLCSSLRPCVPPRRVSSAPSSATGCTAACPPCTFLLILSSPHSAAHSAPHSAPVCLLAVSHQLHPAQRAARQHALLALSFLSYPLPTLLLTLLLTPPLCASSPCLISSIQRNGLHGSMPSLHFPSYPILSPLCCSLCSSLRPCVPPRRVSSAPSSATGCTAACPPCTFLLILSSPHSAAHSAPHSAPVCLLAVSHQLHPAQRAARQHALLALSFLSYPLPTLLLTLLLTPPLCASSPCLISSIQRNGLHGSMPSLHFPSYPILSPLCCSLCSSLRPCVPPHRVSSAPSSATGCTAACPPCTFLLILSSPHSAAHSAPHSAPVCLLTVSHQLHPAQRAARQHALLALSFLSYPLPTLLLTLLLTPPLCASSPCLISSIQRNGLHGSMPSLHFPSYPILSPLCCSLCSSLRPCVPPHRVSSAPSSATGCTAACPPCTFLLILSSPHSAAHSAPHSAPVCLLTVSHQLHPAQRAARQHALLALSFLSYPLPTLLLTLLLTPPLCASSPCLISSIQRNGLHGSMPSLHFPSYPILSPLCCSLCSSLRPCVPPRRVSSAPSSATGCTAACPPCTFLLILSSPHSAAHSAPHSAPVCLLAVSHQLHPAQRAARQHALLALSFLSYPLPTLLLTLLLTPPLCASSPCLISSIQRNGLHGSMPSLHLPSYPILSPLCCSLCSSLRPCVPPHRVSSAPSSATGCTAACPPCTFLLILSSPHSAAHSAPHSAPVCLLTVSHQLHPAQRAARQHALLALSFLSYPLPTLLLTLLLTPPLCASSPCLISSIQRNGLHGSMPSLHFPSYPILSPLCCSLCSSLRPCVPPHRVSSAPSSATGCTAACPPCTFLLILSSPHSAAHSAPHSAPEPLQQPASGLHTTVSALSTSTASRLLDRTVPTLSVPTLADPTLSDPTFSDPTPSHSY
ncbi:unnamed protein product [Closterium sp. Naga37s-1]|nr:unnamed protein product [Closterium sp. Naga37s-1]